MSATDTTSEGTTTGTSPADAEAASEDLAISIVEHVTASLAIQAVHVGLALGLYEALDEAGPVTPGELAEVAGIHPRYAREWLETQAVAGFVTADADEPDDEARRYHLNEAQRNVTTVADSPFHVAPMASGVYGIGTVLDRVIEAYRTGGGVPFEDFGPGIRHAIARGNHPMFVNELGSEWLPAVADIDARLRAEPPARVLDLGCGTGSSSVAIATAYPAVEVHGVDLDAASVEEARDRAAEAGVDDRVTFTQGDAAALEAEDAYDLVTIFEALHDMSDPAGALAAARRALTADGSLLLADERVGEAFSTDAGLVERFMYGWSALHCVPATMAEDPVEVCGTVLREPTVRRLADEAGFAEVEVLPIENDFWRFYRMRG